MLSKLSPPKVFPSRPGKTSTTVGRKNLPPSFISLIYRWCRVTMVTGPVMCLCKNCRNSARTLQPYIPSLSLSLSLSLSPSSMGPSAVMLWPFPPVLDARASLEGFSVFSLGQSSPPFLSHG